MADDIAPILPDKTSLEERARSAGVNLDALSDVARVRLLREFYTPAERKALEAKNRAEIAEDMERYNAFVEKHGFWNAGIKPW